MQTSCQSGTSSTSFFKWQMEKARRGEGTVDTHLPLQKTTQTLRATRADENVERRATRKCSHEVFIDRLFCDQSECIGQHETRTGASQSCRRKTTVKEEWVLTKNQSSLCQEPAARRIVPLVLSHAVRHMACTHLILTYQKESQNRSRRVEGTHLVF
jgi:hypothetical protein